MPKGSAEERARQTALLRSIAHERFVAPRVGELLDGLGENEEVFPHDSYEASLVKVTRRDYLLESKKPADFVRRFA